MPSKIKYNKYSCSKTENPVTKNPRNLKTEKFDTFWWEELPSTKFLYICTKEFRPTSVISVTDGKLKDADLINYNIWLQEPLQPRLQWENTQLLKGKLCHCACFIKSIFWLIVLYFLFCIYEIFSILATNIKIIL